MDKILVWNHEARQWEAGIMLISFEGVTYVFEESNDWARVEAEAALEASHRKARVLKALESLSLEDRVAVMSELGWE